MKRLTALSALALPALLCASCAPFPASTVAICAETRPERAAHAQALTTAPTAHDDLVTGAALLSVMKAGCRD